MLGHGVGQVDKAGDALEVDCWQQRQFFGAQGRQACCRSCLASKRGIVGTVQMCELENRQGHVFYQASDGGVWTCGRSG